MAQQTREINWDRLEIAIPAFLIIIGMPLTYSISDGMALGIISYPIAMIAAKRGKEVHPLMYGLFFVFIGFIAILNV
jgi:AGZA family xanthine/uracil permease-like MFS transporter